MRAQANKDTARGETINLRASRRQKVLIDRAAETLGRSRSDFMLEAACREAESVLTRPAARGSPRTLRLYIL
jgi:uncharacterized protein (DUF1778 family)